MSSFDWSQQTVLITGGTGFFGKKFCEILLREKRPKKLIVFSRDELKQHDMQKAFADDEDVMRYFIGDVRDRDRLYRAMKGVDVVVHAAALKQVPACEYNPFEAVKTNIVGASHIIDAAIDTGVQRVLAISTDKAVNPVNLYGATKLCAEKLFVHGNAYTTGATQLSCVRYGNVVGSRGSVIPVFKQQRPSGVLTVTDARMTRFWITLDQGANFVIRSIELMHGGEVFVPKIPSMRIVELAKAVARECRLTTNGIRAGEKIHEVLLTEDESRHAKAFDDFFVIIPEYSFWDDQRWADGKPLPDGFRYSSDQNEEWMDTRQLRKIAELD